MLLTYNLLGLLFDHEDWGSMFLRNVGELLDYTASEPGRSHSSVIIFASAKHFELVDIGQKAREGTQQ
jgi:hypothetical protein